MPRNKATSVFAKRSHLEILVAIADAGSITYAAHALGATQPYLSRILADLEVIAGEPLFDRLAGRGRGVSPTIVGSIAVERARRILRAMDDADAALETIRDALADSRE